MTFDGDSLVATATATPSAEQEGARQLMCSVTLGGESRETQENLTVYSKGIEWGRLQWPGLGPESHEGGACKVGGASTPEQAGREAGNE